MYNFSSSFSLFESIFLLMILILIPFIVYAIYKNPVKEQGLKKAFISFIICLCSVILFLALNFRYDIGFPGTEKPVIYLYPQKALNVTVNLKYNGILKCTYPDYTNGWNVIAHPDGTLLDTDDNHIYQYLYWEGETDFKDWNMTKGFVIPGNDTKDFLQKILTKLGLSNSETNEFIVYWLPKMQDNKYNLIHFADKVEYEKLATLSINPKPDSFLRVFMVYKPLNKYIKIPEQSITPFVRNGFTAVEWGGTELK